MKNSQNKTLWLGLLTSITLSGCGAENNPADNSKLRGDSAPTPMLTISKPVALSDQDVSNAVSEVGYSNNSGKPIFFYGTLQLWNVSVCKTANVEIKWDNLSNWTTLQHYFYQGQGGSRYSFSVLLAPDAKIRVRADVTPTGEPALYCFENGVPSGRLDAPNPGWYYSIAE